MEKILISSCLLGSTVRYDGKHNDHRNNAIISQWLNEGRLVSICPEVAGGLPVPRSPAVIVRDENKTKVLTKENQDVTSEYLNGAKKTLNLALKNNIKLAILKNRSPSCGSTHVYDNFDAKTLVVGAGLTTSLLEKNGIKIFHEEQLEEALVFLQNLEKRKSP